MADNGDVLLLLGEIKGELKGVNQRLDKVDAMDARLRAVETKAAINGAYSGSAAAVGVLLITEAVKAAFRSHGT